MCVINVQKNTKTGARAQARYSHVVLESPNVLDNLFGQDVFVQPEPKPIHDKRSAKPLSETL